MSAEIFKPDQVVFAINGIVVNDLSESDFIALEWDGEHVTKTKDNSDGGIYNATKGRGGKISIKVLPTSQWITWLSHFSRLRMPVAITLEDTNSYAHKAKYICETAMIEQEPSASFSSEASPVDISFTCLNIRNISTGVKKLIPTINLG